MNLRGIPLVLAGFSVALTGGCDKKDPAPSSATSVVQPVASAPASNRIPRTLPRDFVRRQQQQQQRRRQNDVVSVFVRAATSAPDLTDEQRTKMGGLQPKSQGLSVRGESVEYRTALMDSVKSGKVDAAVFAKHAEAMEKAREQKRAERVARLNDLHGILTPPQRKAVADSVRATFAGESKARVKQPGGDVPRLLPKELRKGGRGPLGRGPGNRLTRLDSIRRGPAMGHGDLGFMGMVDGIELTPEQQKKLEELTKKTETSRPTDEERAARRDEARKAALAVVDAFEKDAFDAAKLELFKPGAGDATWLQAHLAYFEAFLAVLTEQQRGDLANNLEARGVPPLEMPSMDELAVMPEDPEKSSPTEPSEVKKPEAKPAKPAE